MIKPYYSTIERIDLIPDHHYFDDKSQQIYKGNIIIGDVTLAGYFGIDPASTSPMNLNLENKHKISLINKFYRGEYLYLIEIIKLKGVK